MVAIASAVLTAAPAPTATPAVAGELAHAKVGGDVGRTLQFFNVRAPENWEFDQYMILADHPSHGALMTFLVDDGRAVMRLIVDQSLKIHMAAIIAQDIGRSTIVDPYGVMLGDTLERLATLRGKPDWTYNDGTQQFGPSGQLHWDYVIKQSKVNAIIVSDLK